jgi:hypothetical protein
MAWKPFGKTKFGHGQLILYVVCRTVLYVYVPYVLGRTESIFVEISFPHHRRDDEDRRFVRLSLGKIPSDRGKSQRSDKLESFECITALSFFQEL